MCSLLQFYNTVTPPPKDIRLIISFFLFSTVYVEYKSIKSATAAMKKMQNAKIHDRTIRISFYYKIISKESVEARKQKERQRVRKLKTATTSNCLRVKNLSAFVTEETLKNTFVLAKSIWIQRNSSNNIR